jgi:hypothetical protein
MRFLLSSLTIVALSGLAGCDELDEAAEDVGDVFDDDEDGGGGGGGAPDVGAGPIPVRPGDIDDPDRDVDGGGGGGGGDGDGGGPVDCYKCPDEAGHFYTDFVALNDSDVHGHSLVTVDVHGLTFWLRAEGLEPQRPMGQAVYGYFDQYESRCPTDADDVDGDGWISRQELSESTGRVVLDMSPYPVSSSAGIAAHDMIFAAANSCPLVQRSVLLFGGMRDGVWDPDLPVACGELHVATDDELRGLGVLD